MSAEKDNSDVNSEGLSRGAGDIVPVVASTLPAFLPAEVADYLWAVSSSEKWRELLTRYFEFEKEGPLIGVSFAYYIVG